MLDPCPGAANIRTPTLTIKKCLQCGAEVEVFSNDVSVKCSGCGFVVYNDIESCIHWCKHAKECVGEEMYRKLMEGKTSPLNRKGSDSRVRPPASSQSLAVPGSQSLLAR